MLYFLEEFMDLSYVNMYKFRFIFRNGPTTVRKSGNRVLVPVWHPIIRLGGGRGVRTCFGPTISLIRLTWTLLQIQPIDGLTEEDSSIK